MTPLGKYEKENAGTSCKIEDILGDEKFLRGYQEIFEGKPFDYEAAADNWEYERGRQFALLQLQHGRKKTPLKIKQVKGPFTPTGISRAAIIMWIDMKFNRWIN